MNAQQVYKTITEQKEKPKENAKPNRQGKRHNKMFGTIKG